MDISELKHQIYQFNQEELFYKEQYEAREAGQIYAYIAKQDIKDVIKRHLLIPEVKETIPSEFKDSFFFDMTDKDSIVVQKHNRYSPALVHSHTFLRLVYVYDGRCTQNISGQTLFMKIGDFCVIPPSVEHSISVYDDSIIINIMLRRNTLHSMFYSFLNTPNKLSSFFLNNIMQKEPTTIFFSILEWILIFATLFAGCYGKVSTSRPIPTSALQMYCSWIFIFWSAIIRNLYKCRFSITGWMYSAMRSYSIFRIITGILPFLL